jgi:hypothetical protein
MHVQDAVYAHWALMDNVAHTTRSLFRCPIRCKLYSTTALSYICPHILRPVNTIDM